MKPLPRPLFAQCTLALCFSIIAAAPLSAQVNEHLLTASDADENDIFGASVSLWDARALIGAQRDDDQGEDSGSAYIWEKQVDGSWMEVFKLLPSDGASLDAFGGAVSLWEDRALVGAVSDDDQGTDSGSAYIFERQGDGTWIETAKLLASDGENFDFFGTAVALFGDRAFVGSPRNGEPGNFSGSAYIFERQGDGMWIEVAQLTASDRADIDDFGGSVSLGSDRALIGARRHDALGTDSGSAYIFERQGDGTWVETAKLLASDGDERSEFGWSVSLAADQALIGAPGQNGSGAAYVFDWQNDGSWIEQEKLLASDGIEGDGFGRSVSLSGRALIGAFAKGSLQGIAYLFEEQTGGAWSEVSQITASDGVPGDFFGLSVSLYANQGIVGAGGRKESDVLIGAAYIFDNLDALHVAVEESPVLPPSVIQTAVYPNPFGSLARVRVATTQAEPVRVEVFDLLGKRVRLLHDGPLVPHTNNTFEFEANQLSAGFYVLRVTSASVTATRMITHLR